MLLIHFAFLLILDWASTATISDKCSIPGNEIGKCIKSEDCEAYKKAMETIEVKHIEFLRHVQCKVEKTIAYVCCPSTPSYKFVEIPKPSKVRDRSKEKQELGDRFGDGDECGIQAGADRVFGGVITAIDEFPWMALIEYAKTQPNGKPVLACGGVLINKRYVLTAAHCVTGSGYEALGKIVSVRLGEYNLEAEQDCVVESEYQDCADPVVNPGVDELVVHPEYEPTSRDQKHDIALIRLDTAVNYTDFIKPICLPDSASPQFSVRSGDVLQVSGWGKTETHAFNSPVKLKIGVPVVEPSDCQKSYKKYGITLSEGQICAGGVIGKDSCKGDSGGPLMAKDELTGSWITSGVVSLGPNRCGLLGIPGVYTNVKQYVSWIKESMKP